MPKPTIKTYKKCIDDFTSKAMKIGGKDIVSILGFGSVIKGKGIVPGISDIDLLLILPEKDGIADVKSLMKINHLANKLSKKYGIDITLCAQTFNEFQGVESTYREVILLEYLAGGKILGGKNIFADITPPKDVKQSATTLALEHIFKMREYMLNTDFSSRNAHEMTRKIMKQLLLMLHNALILYGLIPETYEDIVKYCNKIFPFFPTEALNKCIKIRHDPKMLTTMSASELEKFNMECLHFGERVINKIIDTKEI